ncbi:hypothetical protein UFOVP1087_37 [uncultured Caudovirales phage]|uniref:Uncharacterized protein n=1 Tax=uncultured Caudovirales phage TaxID=2100421 RepID=A0A6J7XG96_9CAUD|nr:hypothetical protein UFOVP910_7 [uncultured Caudovirales phage]CAB4183059.1 hypothetical protein UFOVP1087_37 [uncultured Caudovirales phage]CAB5228187.1 hypothetical protein UFOVP1534_8 [uncultured Caudovirales phage]
MSNIEIFAWCSTRELFVTGMTTTTLPDGSTLATLDENGALIPHAGIIIDEIGPITKTPATYDEDGDIVTPAVIIAGHHVNLMATGAIASMLIMGPPDAEGNPTTLPQYDDEGNLLSVFQRTNILGLIPGMVWTPLASEGVPSGYEGPNGVLLFDPAVVTSRARVFL